MSEALHKLAPEALKSLWTTDSELKTVMSKLLLDVPATDVPTTPLPVLPEPGSPVTLADRISLRVGLWLLLRSVRRATHRADHGNHARLRANETARIDRDHATLRMHQLSLRA